MTHPSAEAQRLLVVTLSNIGDVVMTTPLFEALTMVVVDEQNAFAGQAGRGGPFFTGRRRGRQLHDKRAAVPLLTLRPDAPAQQSHQPLRDGQTEPGAAEAARGRSVDLAEGLEQPIHPVGGDADAGVAHEEAQPDPRVVGRAEHLDAHNHLAALGELHGVTREVHEDLSHARHIAEHDGRGAVIEVAQELQILLRNARSDHIKDRLKAVLERKRLALQLQLAGLDLRVVEDVVDDFQQRIAGLPDRLGQLLLLAGQRGAQEQSAHADHGVEGRADLVAHVGEEIRLRHRRGLRLLARCHQFPGTIGHELLEPRLLPVLPGDGPPDEREDGRRT